MGRYFNAFGVTVSTTIAISLVIAVTLTPFLCSRIMGRSHKPTRLEIALERPFLRLEEQYERALGFAVRHRALVLSSGIALFILGMSSPRTSVRSSSRRRTRAACASSSSFRRTPRSR